MVSNKLNPDYKPKKKKCLHTHYINLFNIWVCLKIYAYNINRTSVMYKTRWLRE